MESDGDEIRAEFDVSKGDAATTHVQHDALSAVASDWVVRGSYQTSRVARLSPGYSP
jgi:hypothetical protein